MFLNFILQFLFVRSDFDINHNDMFYILFLLVKLQHLMMRENIVHSV